MLLSKLSTVPSRAAEWYKEASTLTPVLVIRKKYIYVLLTLIDSTQCTRHFITTKETHQAIISNILNKAYYLKLHISLQDRLLEEGTKHSTW